MGAPVFVGGAFALEAVRQKVAEGLTAVIENATVTLDEEHGRVERPRHVVVVAWVACFPKLLEQTRARGFHVQPHVTAVAEQARGFTFDVR